MKPTMEIKKRYKMYKKGKHWVRAAILFVGATGVMSVTTQAYADELPNPSGTETVITTPETPPAGAETVRETPKDATSQPTKIEEVAPVNVTTENPSVVENNTTVSEETPVEEQPVVRAEQPAEPIGTPTESANSADSANQAATITKEFPTPELDQAVAEAQKDPHITVVKEANQDLGTVTTDQLAQKEVEIAEKQRTQAQEITQKVADVKRQNAEIEKFNAEVVKQNKAEDDRYAKELAEYNKHKNENGYVSEALVQKLLFTKEQHATQTVLGNKKALTGAEARQAIKKIANDENLMGKAETFAKKQPSFILGVGEQLAVEYELKNSSYDGKKLKKVKYVYTVKEASKAGKVFVSLDKDPTTTIRYFDFYGKALINMDVTFYDESGNVVKPKDGLLSFSSLNKDKNSVEYVKGFNGIYKEINGSSIKAHGKDAYAAKSNDKRTEGSAFDLQEWDSASSANQYYGAIVGVAGDHINFSFGSENRGYIWFAFNTDLKAKSVIPTVEHKKPKKFVNATVEYHGYSANIAPVVTPNKEVTDGTKNINDLNVKRGDALKYIVTADTRSLAGIEPEKITTQGIRDTFDASKVTITNGKIKVYQASGNLNDKDLPAVLEAIRSGQAKDVTASYEIAVNDNVVTAMMKKNANGSVVLPMGYKYLLELPFVVKNVVGDFTNTAVQLTNNGETMTNTVINHIPNEKVTPVKDVKANKQGVVGTVSIHNKDIQIGTPIFYEITSSERPANYGGVTEEWSMNDVLDTVHDRFTGTWKALTNYDLVVNGATLTAGTDITSYVTLTNNGNKDLTFSLKPALIEALNAGQNKLGKQAWKVYLEVERIKAGDVENTQTENYNSDKVRSNTVITHTPEDPTPHKTVKNDKKVDINNKQVMRGDTLIYDMTWDLTGYDRDFAFETVDVATGVAFFDDYDETKVTPVKDHFQVLSAKGMDLTDQFTVRWNDEQGSIRIEAKDPQAFIEQHGGQALNVVLPVKVKVNVSGDVYNQASQHTFGKEVWTEQVVNHIPKINTKKDVVVNVGDAVSINGKKVANTDVFNYRLDSSVRPADIGTDTHSWTIRDVLDTRDQVTGQHTILSNYAFIGKAGETVKKGSDVTKYFAYEVTTDDQGRQVVHFSAVKDFLDLLNLDVNKATEQGFSVFFQVKRNGFGQVDNTFIENYNDSDITSNVVNTFTPDDPTPHKTVKNGKKADINNKQVMRGDTLIYDMTWDLTGYDRDFAFGTVDVATGVAFFDDYDETKVTPVKELVQVLSADDTDLTNEFDLVWDDEAGTIRLEAKTPQAFIEQHGGQALNVVLPVKVKVNVSGDVYNQASQHTFGKEVRTEQVVNHIPQINTKKDVVVNVGDAVSINGKKVANTDVFNYRLDSSVRPADIGTDTLSWTIRDVLDTRDQVTGQHTILSNYAFIGKAGETVKKGSDVTKYFAYEVTTDDQGRQVVHFSAVKDFLDLLNLDVNKATEQGFSVFFQVKRNGFGQVDNTFIENYNDSDITSNVVNTFTPDDPTPHKTVKNTLKADINDKNVMRGDTLIYDMTWDLTGYDKDFAFGTVDVTKGVAFFDDYDETKVTPIKDQLKVFSATGNDLTSEFQVIWDDVKGNVRLEAKTPQTFIESHGGQVLNVVLPVKVKANISGDVYNQAIQQTFSKEVKTEQVVNHIPKINPTKDVVIKVGDKQSLNHKRVAHNAVFNYSLASSIRPANVGVDTAEWSMMDILSDKDQATGHFAVLAARSFVLPNGKKVEAGTDISHYFEYKVTKNSENKTVVSVHAKKEFLAAINLPENKATEQGWTAFVQVKRVGYGDVENTFTESYNNEVLKSNTVVTHTPKEPVPATPVKETPKQPEIQQMSVEKATIAPELPQTGEKENSLLAMVGAGMLAIGAWFGLKKRKEN